MARPGQLACSAWTRQMPEILNSAWLAAEVMDQHGERISLSNCALAPTDRKPLPRSV